MCVADDMHINWLGFGFCFLCNSLLVFGLSVPLSPLSLFLPHFRLFSVFFGGEAYLGDAAGSGSGGGGNGGGGARTSVSIFRLCGVCKSKAA